MIYLKTVTLSERAGLNNRISAFFAAVVFLFSSLACFGQQKEEADSLVRLLEANSAHLQEVNGVPYRKVVGPARFLHNNTYLLCDTALWNVNTNVIDAIGHVQIIQENTFLRSDRIEYLVNENLAKFRGSVVELFDKEGNILKTNFLDYNTKDSIATFFNGGALSNNKGDIIESIDGAYYSKDKLFVFEKAVNMFTDSVFIVSDRIDYRTDLNKAYFGNATTAWQEDNILSANSGEFDRENDIFIFNKDGHILSRDQEIWADLLTYYRKSGNADLYRNVQILDTVQSAIALADKATYRPAILTVELTEKPAVGLYTVENGVKDTLFMAADTMIYFKKRYFEIDSSVIASARERRMLSDIDPVAIAESRKPEAATGSMDLSQGPGKAPGLLKGIPAGTSSGVKPSADSLKTIPKDTSGVPDKTLYRDTLTNVPKDTLAFAGDSLTVATDSILIVNGTAVPDTTQIVFIDAYHHVKIYRGDLQGLCDSLVYTGIDSIARFYKDPVFWNDIKHQFTADSIQAVLKNNALTKINLLSNAYIISQEDSIHFNQVKSPEMAAYFANNDLYRYDALGGVSAIFFLEEDSVITVMNQKESKMLSAKIKDRQVQRLKYLEQIKNDAFPVFNLPADQLRLRGFTWRAEERPKERSEVTDRVIKPSRRLEIETIPSPDYMYTGVYFPQRKDSIMRYMAFTDSVKMARKTELERERLRNEKEQRMKEANAGRDSLLLQNDTLHNREIPASDSLSKQEAVPLKTEGELSATKEGRAKAALTGKQKKRELKKEARRLRKEEKRLKRERRKQEKLAKKQRKKADAATS